MAQSQPTPAGEAFRRFHDLARRLAAVPKREIDERREIERRLRKKPKPVR